MNETIPLFQTIGGALDGATATFVIDSVDRMITVVKPWVLSIVTIWVLYYGFMVLSGRIREPTQEGIIACARIVIITALALNTGVYLQWIVSTLQGLQETMVSVLTGKGNVSLWESLDGSIDSGYKLFELCMIQASDAGFMHMGPMLIWLLAGCMIIISFGLIVIGGGASILVATLALRILFAVGPVFLLCLMFQGSRGFWDNWLGACITYLTQIVVVAAMLVISIRIFESIASGIDLGAAADQSVMRITLMLFGTGLLLFFCMKEAGRLAGSLGGRVSSEILTAAGIAYSAAAPGRAAKQAINPTSRRMDPVTGHRTESSRLEHLAAGRTALSPVYRQVVLNRMKAGWK